MTSPVRFGDTITVAYAKVGESEDGKRVRARVEARNQHDDVVAVAEHIVWCAGQASTA